MPGTSLGVLSVYTVGHGSPSSLCALWVLMGEMNALPVGPHRAPNRPLVTTLDRYPGPSQKGGVLPEV